MSHGRRGAFPASQRPGGSRGRGGGAGPPPRHRTHLWNVLALTEQRRRRAQATLDPGARPPRQPARPIGGRPSRARSSLAPPRVNRALPRPFCFPRLRSPPRPAPRAGSPCLHLPSPPPRFPEACAASRERKRPESGAARPGFVGLAGGGRWRSAPFPSGVCRPRCAGALPAADARPGLGALSPLLSAPWGCPPRGKFYLPTPWARARTGRRLEAL